MARRDADWRPESAKPDNVANLRVCLALLRIYRGVQLRSADMDYASLAMPFWPLLRRQRDLLLSALGKARIPALRKRGKPGRAGEDAQEQLTRWLSMFAGRRRCLPLSAPDNAVLEIVGDAMVHGSATLRPLLDAVEADLDSLVASRRFERDTNVEHLSQLLALTPAEQRFFSLAAAACASGIGTAPFAAATGPTRLFQAIQVALGIASEHEVRSMLRRSARLLRSGMLDINGVSPTHDMEDLLRLSRVGMLLLTSKAKTQEALAATILKQAPVPSKQALEWPHLEERTQLLHRILAESLAGRQAGMNILLYGAPGTGKTEFAARLVRQVGASGYSVSDRDADGDPASREVRLASLMLTQVFAPRGRSIVVLDEAEDVFQGEYNNALGRTFGRRDQSKSWINSLLEANVSPVIWISNRIEHMDPAYLRRFSYCLEFPATPRRLRLAVARAHLEAVGCSPPVVDAVAADPYVSPALVASAAGLIRLAKLDGSGADAAVKLTLGDTMKAMGRSFRSSVAERSTRFDLRYLNTKGAVSAQAVVAGIERLGRGRVLLSGPPGTGKTQLAAEVAQRLGRELAYKTASDINSKWFGDSERNVARMFEECDPQRDVLFLDEADTLLGSRQGSAQRAEVAVTAEFLRQIEAFQGIFMCATNFRASLDLALLRRFEYRLELQALDCGQRRALFCESALGWGGDGEEPQPALDTHVGTRLDRMDQLTPGDFANVVRRVRSLQLHLDAGGWLDELQAEHETKPGVGRKTIGFT